MTETAPPIAVGVLVEPGHPAWAVRAIASIAAEPSVGRVVVVRLEGAAGRRRLGDAALALLGRLDRALVRPGADAFASMPLPSTEALEIVTAQPQELAGTVRRAALDVLVNLTQLDLDARAFREIPGLPLWELRHGGVRAGAPHALFRELAAGEGTCDSVLVRRDTEQEEMLYASTSAVSRLSLHRTRTAVHWKGAVFPARALRLQALGAEQPGRADVAASERRPATPPPGVAAVALLQLKLVRRSLAFLRERFLHTWSWSIAWQARERPATATPDFRPDGILEPPSDRVYADPFVIDDDGDHYVFYEDYRADMRRAAIAVSRVVDGGLSSGQAVIRAPYHLSYPFTFRWDGDYYLVPESAEAHVVQLFRAVRFPYEWELDATLLAGVAAYDATIVREHDRWFMFAAVPVEGADVDELHVFWSTALWGPYESHPLNPVVSDARRARPAGRVFRDGDRLLRPGQDASTGYGSAVWLSEIELLTPTDYRERPLCRIEPAWSPGASGTHTIDHAGGLQVMDVKHLRPRWRLHQRAPVAT